MLKINFSETAVDEKWILHRRLSGPWVDELRTCWQVNHSTDAGRAASWTSMKSRLSTSAGNNSCAHWPKKERIHFQRDLYQTHY